MKIIKRTIYPRLKWSVLVIIFGMVMLMDGFVFEAAGTTPPPPPCAPCRYGDGCSQNSCGNCGACLQCNTTTNECTVPKIDPNTETCCQYENGCSVCNWSQCNACEYDGSCAYFCDPNKCETCDGAGHCVVCGGDPNTCETCIDGICKVCGGNPNQKCCNGSCCDKVWTKKTNTSINESCPSAAHCSEPGYGCDGKIVKQQQSYDSCLNVGVGQAGEHCDCHQSLQVVGYKYTCQEDWDWSLMASCALEAALCALHCVGAHADPALCAECLAGLELDCCGGDTCHICDFLESCDPLYPEEIKDQVFTDFGDCG